MIFEGKSLTDILDAELDSLVREHIAEQQHLEFKATLNHKSDEEKLQLLLEVASLANGGGGYLVIGVRDDGKGRAQKYENPGDTARIAKSIRDLCHAYIEQRIDGLEIQERTVNGNPLVVVHVPVSARTPHMVTFNRGTHFWARYQDGKREMTLAEIHEIFTQDLLNRRLLSIMQDIQRLGQDSATQRQEELRRMIEGGEAFARLQTENGREVLQANADAVKTSIGARPCFFIAAAPEGLRPGSVNVDQPEIRSMFNRAPDSRIASGWVVTSLSADVQRFSDGIRYRNRTLEQGQLELLTNGHMSYTMLLGELFYWRQTPQDWERHPRLWPGPVIEFPLSFLKLFRAICKRSELGGPFHVLMQYLNIRGHILPAGAPTLFGFLGMWPVTPLAEQHLRFMQTLLPDFIPDVAAYDLVQTVYAAFGYDQGAIPFWDSTGNRFHFPPI